MTNDSDYRMKMRAVFLAAIMVVSVFGASVAFTGSAAADVSAISGIDGGSSPGITAGQSGLNQSITLQSVNVDGSDTTINIEFNASDGSDLQTITAASANGNNNQNGHTIQKVVHQGNGLVTLDIAGASTTGNIALEIQHDTTGLTADPGAEIGAYAETGSGTATSNFDIVGTNGLPVFNTTAHDTTDNDLSSVSYKVRYPNAFSDSTINQASVFVTDGNGNTASSTAGATNGNKEQSVSVDLKSAGIAPGDSLTVHSVVQASGDGSSAASASLFQSQNSSVSDVKGLEITSTSSNAPVTQSDTLNVDVTVDNTGQNALNGGEVYLNNGSSNLISDDTQSFVAPGPSGGTVTATVSSGFAAGAGGSSLNSQISAFASPSGVGVGNADSSPLALNIGTSGGSNINAEYRDRDDNTANVIYQGRNIYLLGGEVNSSASGNVGNLRVVDSFTSSNDVEASSQVEQLDVVQLSSSDVPVSAADFNGFGGSTLVVEIDTDDLDNGFYFFRGGGTGLPQNPAEEATFEVTGQTLNAPFDEDDEPALTDDFGDSQVSLDLNSGRGTYAVNASAGGNLDNDELFNIFALEAIDGTRADENGFNEIQNTSSDAFWNATDDGGLDIVSNSDGSTLLLQNGDAASFDSPYAVYESAVRGNHHISFANNSDIVAGANDASIEGGPIENTFTHDSDIVQSTGVTVGSDWRVGLYAEDQDDDSGTDFDEKVILNTGGDVDTITSWAGTDEGDYTVDFEVTDTEATATGEVTASERNADASFEEGTTTDGAGDIAQFELTLEDNDDTFVQIGGPDVDFVEVLYVQADDASEPVTVRYNTRLLGITGNVEQSDVYDTTNVDTLDSAIYSAANDGEDLNNDLEDAPGSLQNIYEDDGQLASDAATSFEDYLDALGIVSATDTSAGTPTVDDQLDRPLQPGDYSITIADYGGEDFVFDANSDGDANNQLDSKTQTLTQPEIGDVTIHTAPEADADDTTNVSELVNAATSVDEVAVDDRLIVQVEATGLYGALVAGTPTSSQTSAAPQDVNFDILDDGTSTARMQNLIDSNESVDLSIVSDAAIGNQAPLEVDLSSSSSDSDAYIILDEENGQFFVVADSGSDSAFANGDAPDEEAGFSAELEYDADDGGEAFEFDNANNDGTASQPFSFRSETATSYRNYPYLAQGTVASTTQEFDLAPRQISFDNVNDEDVLQVANTETASISGTTNVAPGSDAEIRLGSTSASTSFQTGNDVTISEDGSVTTQFDLSNQEVGDEFDTTFRVGGSGIDTTNSVINPDVADSGEEEPADDGEEEEPADDGEEEPADDGEEEPADDGEEEPADDGGSTDDGTPGFGAVVALIALIGAALLAVRRQN